MRVHVSFLLVTVLLATACSSSSERKYTLQGQVLAVDTAKLEATIKHEDIKGFMPAMTMPYRIREKAQLDGLKPGDLISAQLVVLTDDAYLADVKKVGSAPLEATPAAATAAPSASSGFELLKPGEPVPSTTFVDQEGRKKDFSAFAGRVVALTFIYTRCPMPQFCPLMDRNFAAIQRKIAADPALASRAHLVTISFDPANDTPAVLKQHAAQLDADPKLWTFLTGDRDEIDRFAMRFGVSVVRDPNNPVDITHNLRTAIVDGTGKLVKVYTGNEWKPDQIVQDLAGAH